LFRAAPSGAAGRGAQSATDGKSTENPNSNERDDFIIKHANRSTIRSLKLQAIKDRRGRRVDGVGKRRQRVAQVDPVRRQTHAWLIGLDLKLPTLFRRPVQDQLPAIVRVNLNGR